VYFGTASPAAADELPLVPMPVDAAAAIEAVTAEVASEVVLPTADAGVAAPDPPVAPEVAEPQVAPPPPASAEPQQQSQYHAPEPQYQAPPAPVREPDPAVEVGTSLAADSAEPVDATSALEPDPPAAATAATADAAEPEVRAPETWIWNWTWNCDPRTAPQAELPADAAAPNWVWNWAWNCDVEPITEGDSARYQSDDSQYQVENVNVTIRVGSPGDNGDVNQTSSAAVTAAATDVASTAQTIEVSPPPAEVQPLPPLADPRVVIPVPVPAFVAPLFPPLVGVPPLVVVPPLELPSITLPDVSVQGVPATIEISLPALPPIEVALPPVAAGPGAAIASALERALGRARGSAQRREPPARVDPHGAVANEQRIAGTSVAASPWPRPAAVEPAPRTSEHSSRAPGNAPLPSFPRPRAPAAGSAQFGSSANGILTAFAALLAAYLLFPYLAARRVRRPRDRRRLRPRAPRFDPPG
jgi:hypothetical protein